MLRGINKQTIFEEGKDRKRFIETLSFIKPISLYSLFGYCLMDNHVHLLMKENEEPISASIKRISGSYALWFNKKYDRCGHLFQERFKSEPVETDSYFLTVLRYIHQNPVKAGLVERVINYPWSSFFAYTEENSAVDVDYALGLFSSDRAKAVTLFVEFMNMPNSDQCMDEEARPCLRDEEITFALQKLGIDSCTDLHKLDKKQRDRILIELSKIHGCRFVNWHE